MQTGDIGVEVLVHLDAVGVELQLGGVEQGLLGGETGDDLVHRVNEVDDVGHGAVRHGGGDVAGHSVGQGGADIGVRKFLFPCALAVQNIAKALHHNVSCAQHIGQLADLLCIGNGLIEGIGEIVAAEDREVGVAALEFLVAVSVDHGEVVVVILLADKAAGVLTEGAHLVPVGLGVADQLGFVEHAVDGLHDLVAHLDTDANVHCAGLMGDVMFCAEAFQPVRAAPSGGDDRMVAVNLLGVRTVGNVDAFADLVFQNEVPALVAKQDLHAVIEQMLFDGIVQALRLFGAQMTNGASRPASSPP